MVCEFCTPKQHLTQSFSMREVSVTVYQYLVDIRVPTTHQPTGCHYQESFGNGVWLCTAASPLTQTSYQQEDGTGCNTWLFQ